jgi:acetyltransferase-like isoleucine patch superfamily enzyme
MIKQRVANFIQKKWFYISNKHRFKYLADDAVLLKLLRIDGKSNIRIEKGVVIQPMTWLAAVPLSVSNTCELSIGEGSIIGNFNHIYATSEIVIGKKVLTADKVYIADNRHEYENVLTPILEQPIKQLKKVFIGDGTWIGENVCILGVSVGKNCVIGANSVVTKDIPDFSVAVGSPAMVIKKYNFETQLWTKV